MLIIHGPNLNLLGSREPEQYGTDTLEDINRLLSQFADKNKIKLSFFQSNHEGEIVDRIHQSKQENNQFIIINPGAFTHTSIAIRDAFLGTEQDFIEVHLSNVHAREDFRQYSYLSDIAVGVITGLGKDSYLLALQAAVSRCSHKQL